MNFVLLAVALVARGQFTPTQCSGTPIDVHFPNLGSSISLELGTVGDVWAMRFTLNFPSTDGQVTWGAVGLRLPGTSTPMNGLDVYAFDDATETVRSSPILSARGVPSLTPTTAAVFESLATANGNTTAIFYRTLHTGTADDVQLFPGAPIDFAMAFGWGKVQEWESTSYHGTNRGSASRMIPLTCPVSPVSSEVFVPCMDSVDLGFEWPPGVPQTPTFNVTVAYNFGTLGDVRAVQFELKFPENNWVGIGFRSSLVSSGPMVGIDSVLVDSTGLSDRSTAVTTGLPLPDPVNDAVQQVLTIEGGVVTARFARRLYPKDNTDYPILPETDVFFVVATGTMSGTRQNTYHGQYKTVFKRTTAIPCSAGTLDVSVPLLVILITLFSL